MKIKVIFILSITLFTVISISFSQTDSTYTSIKHYFGINGGSTTGVGITYRYMPGKLGLQGAYLPVYTLDEFTSVASFSVIANFWSGKKARFNLYEAQTLIVMSSITDNISDAGGTLGFGTMVEINMGSNIVMTLNGGFCVIADFSGEMFDFDWLIIPDFGIGFFYRI